MIINTKHDKNIYLTISHVDMRKSIDGLLLIVALEFDLDVMNSSLFIFVNRASNRLLPFIAIFRRGNVFYFLELFDKIGCIINSHFTGYVIN